MSTHCLPDNPDIAKLKGDAKVLRDMVRAGIGGAIDMVREHHPRFSDLQGGTPVWTLFKLSDAQVTLARHYGYPSWTKLVRQVELINRLTRSPHAAPIGADLPSDPGDAFLRLACLNFGRDEPQRWDDAARLLAADPDLSSRSLCLAAAVGNLAAARRILAQDPGAAQRQGGPFRWEPLVYLTFPEPRAASAPIVPAITSRPALGSNHWGRSVGGARRPGVAVWGCGHMLAVGELASTNGDFDVRSRRADCRSQAATRSPTSGGGSTSPSA